MAQENQKASTKDVVLVAEVRLRPGLEILLGTEYDSFKRKGYSYLREIFLDQIKNVLNTECFLVDPLLHMETDEF